MPRPSKEKPVPKDKSSGKLIVICKSGGKFTTDADGYLSYTDGEAHALIVNRQYKFRELKAEVAEVCNCDPLSLTMKYFLPDNKRTLITISVDKDIQRLIDFYEDSKTADVFALKNEDLQLFQTQQAEVPVTVPAATLAPIARPSGPIIDEPATPTPVSAFPTQTERPSYLPTIDGDQNLLKSWSKGITGLHQQFNNVHELRDALRKYSIAMGFKCKFKHNENSRVSVKCKAEGCPWKFFASKLSNTELFRIKTMNEVHTCGAGTSGAKRPNLSRKMLATIAKEKLRDSPHLKPKDIAQQIREEFGIELPNSLARRGMDSAREEIQSQYTLAYNQLPSLRDKILETNPGSVVMLVTKEDKSFRGFFVALRASINGFLNGCRPLILLDSMTLKTRYQTDLLTATALDGNDGVFPLAFALVDAIDDDSWHWFLLQLKSAIPTCQAITFVADRHVGLRRSITIVFPDSWHSFSVSHLSEELKRDLKGLHTEEDLHNIIAHLYDAALATTFDGFNRGMETIKSISPEAFDWIRQSDSHGQWANYFFKGSRYNYITAAAGQTFYGWLNEEAILPPVVQIVDIIHQKLVEFIYTRKVDSDKWVTSLTPLVEEKLQKEVAKAQSLKVIGSLGTSVEVLDFLGVVHAVNIDSYSCSCGTWQVNCFPCLHAVAALQHCERNLYEYCSRYYATELFRLTYAEDIYPVPLPEKPPKNAPVEVHPPPLRRQTGPAKQRRIRVRNRKTKKPFLCSNCKGAGHNRTTCPRVLS